MDSRIREKFGGSILHYPNLEKQLENFSHLKKKIQEDCLKDLHSLEECIVMVFFQVMNLNSIMCWVSHLTNY